MVIDSQTKHTRVDQLQPCPEHNNTTTQLQKYYEPHATKSALDDEDSNNAVNPFLFVDHDGSDLESNQNTSLLDELAHQPHHNYRQPK